MNMYTAFCAFISIITFLAGFGFGTLAGYHVLKQELHDYYEYLEYLIRRQDEIRNQKGE